MLLFPFPHLLITFNAHCYHRYYSYVATQGPHLCPAIPSQPQQERVSATRNHANISVTDCTAKMPGAPSRNSSIMPVPITPMIFHNPYNNFPSFGPYENGQWVEMEGYNRFIQHVPYACGSDG